MLPNHGGFAAFYASVGDSHARELGFDDAGRQQTIYGAFTFRLANVIQNRDSVTVRALAESLKTLPKPKARDPALPRRGQRSRTGDVHRPVAALPPTEPIVITNPAPKRGAAAMERPEVDIEGVVNWSAPTKAVLVDGKIAELRPTTRSATRRR